MFTTETTPLDDYFATIALDVLTSMLNEPSLSPDHLTVVQQVGVVLLLPLPN